MAQHNFTDATTQALQEAYRLAQEQKNTEITENHLLKAFLNDPEGLFFSFLLNLNTQPQKLIESVNQDLKRLPTLMGEELTTPTPSRNLSSRIADAQTIAEKWKDSFTSSDHFLLSYWKNGGEPFASWKSQSGLSAKASRRTN